MSQLKIPIDQYEQELYNSNSLRSLKLLFTNYPVCLVNSIRRIILSNIPNISFDDKKKDSIQIIKNTSQAHNEFIKHRLSLIPLTKNKIFNLENNPIISKWDGIKRFYEFQDPDSVETYHLEEGYNDSDGNIKMVYASDFEYHENIMKPDLFTNDYSILMKLKSNPALEEGENLKIAAKPFIGVGYDKVYYNLVGTVTYSFLKENSDVLDEVFDKFLEMTNKERQTKGMKLIEPDTSEYEDLKKSYELLESQKIYKKNDKGEANNIEVVIESINSEEPLQIFFDALSVLTIKVTDLLKFIKFNEFGLINTHYFRLEDALTLTNQYELTINNENHSLGNLMCKYLTNITVDDITDNYNPDVELKNETIFQLVSYKMPHPLTNSIVLRFFINPKISSELNLIYHHIEKASLLNQKYNFPQTVENNKFMEKNMCIVSLIKCVDIISTELNSLKEQFITEQIERYQEKNLKNVVTKTSFLVEGCNYLKDFSEYELEEDIEDTAKKVMEEKVEEVEEVEDLGGEVHVEEKKHAAHAADELEDLDESTSISTVDSSKKDVSKKVHRRRRKKT